MSSRHPESQDRAHPAAAHTSLARTDEGDDRGTRRRATLRSHALEILLFAASIVLLAGTGVAVARTAVGNAAPAGDLTFDALLDELELVLSNGGPDRLGRLEHAQVSAAGQTLVVDTIALLADADDEPATAPGGFIADQVALYNDHAIRQAVLRATPGTSDAARETTAPSLLRTVRTEDGERRLSEYPNPFVLTVRSPYAERAWREVRTADWSSSPSLIGLAGDVALAERTADGSQVALNGNDCTIRRQAQRFLLYCGTTLASDVGRFYDVGFNLDGAGRPFSAAEAFLYRPANLWRNGSTQAFTESAVHAGELFDVRRTGPFMLSVAERGTLAAGQWINGRPSFSNQQLGTISFFAAAGRSGGEPSAAPLVLSLDAALSSDLEAEARRFFDARPGLRRMSVVLLDVRTGEVRAIAEPARRSGAEPLLAFEPLLVGSVVKPLVAAAVLARQPELGDLRLAWAGDTVRTVANVPLDNGFANAANGCAGGIAFRDFIRCSSNQYAAELLVRSLRADGFDATAARNSAARGDGLLVPRAILERSAIGAGLAEAFDVDAFGFRTAGRNPGLWSATTGRAATGGPSASGAASDRSTGSAAIATTDRTLMPWESRPWLIFPQTDGTRLDLLARYAFGGWENRWTLLGLAEAYARIATGREVRARIVADSTRAGDVSAPVGRAFRRVRDALREVPTAGTAAGLTTELRAAVGQDVLVFAKTGTLNERRDRFRSLALALGEPGTLQTATSTAPELACGLVAVSWFDFHDDGRRGASSLAPVHLEFARSGLAATLARHWQRVSGCGQESDGSDGPMEPQSPASDTAGRAASADPGPSQDRMTSAGAADRPAVRATATTAMAPRGTTGAPR